MSIRRLRSRVPSARFVAVARLTEHDLRFHKLSLDGSGKCDAFRTGQTHHWVSGVVFEISGAEKPELDQKEGLGHGYEQKSVLLETDKGYRVRAYTYYAISIASSLQPYHWYKRHVLTGAIEHGLPVEYINDIESVASMDDPLTERHYRELAIYDLDQPVYFTSIPDVGAGQAWLYAALERKP